MDKSDPSIDKDMEMNAEAESLRRKPPKVISVATIKIIFGRSRNSSRRKSRLLK